VGAGQQAGDRGGERGRRHRRARADAQLRHRHLLFTGDFLPAADALAAGLVSEVLPHEDLPGRAREIAAAIAGNDARAVQTLLASYPQTEAEVVAGGYAVEERTARAWSQSGLDLAETGRRRAAVTERGRSQTGQRSS
jgi:enoyl-CoA hydratase